MYYNSNEQMLGERIMENLLTINRVTWFEEVALRLRLDGRKAGEVGAVEGTAGAEAVMRAAWRGDYSTLETFNTH